MGNKFEECRHCVDRGLPNHFGHCRYCKRDLENGLEPQRFRPEQKVGYSNAAENRTPNMVPVMFDEFALQGIHHKCYKELDIQNVIFNEPATIVFWNDGTKTVVKAAEGDEFDPEKGIAMAISKKIFGNQGSYYNKIKKWTKDYTEKPGVLTIYNEDLMVNLRKCIKNLRGVIINGKTLGEMVDKEKDND